MAGRPAVPSAAAAVAFAWQAGMLVAFAIVGGDFCDTAHAAGVDAGTLAASQAVTPAPAPVPIPVATSDTGPGDPGSPTVTARIDGAGVAHVGDPLTLTITAVASKGVPVNLPNVVDLGPFSLLARTEAETDLGDGHVRRDFILQIAAYEPGPQTVPAVEVTYLGKGGDVRQTRTQPVEIKIASLLANEPEPALKENAEPVAVWKRDLTLIYLAGGLLAAALGALLTWLIVRKMRLRVIIRPGPPPRPAHEVALERLDRLGAYGFLENADNRPFYFAVSEIIRDYLGSRFGFDSLELTTDELVRELRRRAEGTVIFGEIEGWLSTCDLVKFAKVSPTAGEARGTLESAIRIVEATRPRHQPQTSVAGTSSQSEVATPVAGGRADG